MATITGIVSDLSAALGLLTSSAAVDVVGVFNSETLAQVFHDARPLKAQVRETSKTMKHPVEKGSSVADHRIIEPVEIYLPVLIPAGFFSSVYNEIKNLFKTATLLAIQTRTGVYQNMFIADFPHEETPEIYDAVTMIIHFTEVILVSSPTIYAPAPVSTTDPKAADFPSKVSNGQVSAAPVTPPTANQVTIQISPSGQATAVPAGQTGWTAATQSGATGAW